MADNPVVEARLIAISEELRCLVCQNESLAGSRAELAEDLRREVRKLIQDGKTIPRSRITWSPATVTSCSTARRSSRPPGCCGSAPSPCWPAPSPA
jgi:hypothetical protein